jgi:hypothetical protein
MGCGKLGIPTDDSETATVVHTTEAEGEVSFTWPQPENGMIPGTPINPINTFGEVPEEYKDVLPELKVDYTEELHAFRRKLAEKYGVDISVDLSPVRWLGNTSWGDTVQLEWRKLDASGMNLNSDIIILEGEEELLRFSFDGGQATSAVANGDLLVIESRFIAGCFPMAMHRSSVPFACERVVSGYNRNGELLWRGAEQLWYTDENGQAFESPPVTS